MSDDQLPDRAEQASAYLDGELEAEDRAIVEHDADAMAMVDSFGRIRAELGREVMVVAITGWGRERDKREAKLAGFDAHLTKPADADALEALLWSGSSHSQSEVDALSLTS